MKKIFQLFVVIGLLLGVAITPAHAIIMEYTDSNIGSRYTLEFNLINDTLTEDVEWFSVYFGQTPDGLNFTNINQFANFSPNDLGVGPELQPADWFSYSYEPNTFLDIPGQFNSDADFLGIAPSSSLGGFTVSSSLGGFTVSFDWTGTGSYDGLYFEVGKFDPISSDYLWLDEGYTTQADVVGGTSVPEPGTMLLLGSGLIGLSGFRKKKKG